MSDHLVVAVALRDVMFMNLIYGLVALCVVYKLAAVAVLSRDFPPVLGVPVRLSAASVGTIIVLKAWSRFEAGDAAEWLDIIRELSWCALLFAVLLLLSRRTR